MRYLLLCFASGLIGSCNFLEKTPADTTQQNYPNSIETDNYELVLPTIQQTGVLILFPGYSETPARIKNEFKIVQPALNKGIAVVLMKFNQRLWLETSEKFRLASTINQLFNEYPLEGDKVYIGGFSISFHKSSHWSFFQE